MSRRFHEQALRRLRATLVLAALGLAVLWPAASAPAGGLVELEAGSHTGVSIGQKEVVGVTTPTGGNGGKVGVSVTEKEVVGVNVPTTPSTPSLPQVNVSVGEKESGQLVGVTVNEQPVVEVPNPVKGKSPSSPVELPTVPGLPGKHGSSGGSSDPTASAASNGRAGLSASGASASRAGASAGSGSTQAAHDGGPTGGASGTGTTGTIAPLGSVPGGGGSAGSHTRAGDSSSNPLASLGRSIPFPLPVPDWSKPIILLLVLIALGFAIRSQLAARRARRLETQRASLERDVEVMQDALVSQVPAELGGLALSVAYRPAEGPATGGDFYDVFETAEGKVAIVLGDVAGHGFPAVKHAALTRFTLRAYLQAGLEPRAAVSLAGNALAAHDDDVLATVAVGVYDTKRATLTYALAGHPPPILRNAGLRDSISICCSPPLGWSVPTGRRQRTISLRRGAEVCFFSDGLIEARTGDGGGDELLGRERLRELVDELGPERDAEELLGAIRAEAVATPDDMAVCIVRAQAPAATGTPVDQEELELDGDTLAGGTVAELLAACGVRRAEIDRVLGEAATIGGGAHRTAILHIDHHTGEVGVSAHRAGAPATPAHEQSEPAAELARAPAALGAGALR